MPVALKYSPILLKRLELVCRVRKENLPVERTRALELADSSGCVFPAARLNRHLRAPLGSCMGQHFLCGLNLHPSHPPEIPQAKRASAGAGGRFALCEAAKGGT
jgi:hypothetical protein